MNEFVSALRQFIARDVMYALGGSYVLLALILLYFGSIAPIQEAGGAFLALWIGAGYIVGFADQETLSLTPLITTQAVTKPGRIVSWLYRLFTKTTWEKVSVEDWAKKHHEFEEKASEREYQNFQRLLSLKHIGTAVGSSLLITAALLLFAGIRFQYKGYYVASGVALALAIALLITGWIKGAQQVQSVVTWKSAK